MKNEYITNILLKHIQDIDFLNLFTFYINSHEDVQSLREVYKGQYITTTIKAENIYTINYHGDKRHSSFWSEHELEYFIKSLINLYKNITLNDLTTIEESNFFYGLDLDREEALAKIRSYFLKIKLDKDLEEKEPVKIKKVKI